MFCIRGVLMYWLIAIVDGEVRFAFRSFRICFQRRRFCLNKSIIGSTIDWLFADNCSNFCDNWFVWVVVGWNSWCRKSFALCGIFSMDFFSFSSIFLMNGSDSGSLIYCPKVSWNWCCSRIISVISSRSKRRWLL